jgi:deoxyadenosine/deoxycytidine kinase
MRGKMGAGYLAIEGPIGVGKTTLAEILAGRFGGRLILELAEENPFLNEFYKNRQALAFHTQIFFLMSRFRQQEEFAGYDLFNETIVSDYLFAKDRIFACINLSDRELALYDRVATALERNIVWPDLVIYLTASLETLTRRIRRRDRAFERSFDTEYLEALRQTYADYFFHFDRTPLLVVNTDNVDFSDDPGAVDYLVEKILSRPDGTEYISLNGMKFGGR